METGNKPVPNPVVVLREEFDDWAILFNPDTAEAVGINPVGVAIWKLLTGKHTMEDVVLRIKESYTEVPGSAVREIHDFVDALTQRGFVGSEIDTAFS